MPDIDKNRRFLNSLFYFLLFIKINCIMKEKFPNWFKNKYYKTMNIKYKIICTLLYKEKLNLLKIILK